MPTAAGARDALQQRREAELAAAGSRRDLEILLAAESWEALLQLRERLAAWLPVAAVGAPDPPSLAEADSALRTACVCRPRTCIPEGHAPPARGPGLDALSPGRASLKRGSAGSRRGTIQRTHRGAPSHRCRSL